MNFKQWLLSEEQLFNEDFKTQREKFIQQGIQPDIVDSYLNNFRTIKDKKYKQINDPIHGLERIKDRTNVDAYKTFHELEILVDYVKGQVDVSGQTSYKNIKVDAKPIYEDNDLIVYYADSPQACITYKGSVPYSWCIARSDSSNMFYTYRFKEYEPAFYFVKNKERTNNEFKFLNLLRNMTTLSFKDKYHFFVIQVVKNANPQNKDQKQYIVTSASNDGDKQMSWNDIVKIEPKLANKESLFISKPLQPKEKELHSRFIKGISDKEFEKLPYDEKDMYLNIYVRMDRNLTDNQFKNLPFDLKNKYIGFGVGLSDEQMKMIDSKLYKRYEEVTKTKIEKTIGTDNFRLKPSEFNIFMNFANESDFNKLSDKNILYLLAYATDKDGIAELIINKKQKLLSDKNVENLLQNATDKDKIAELIINKKQKLLSDDNVFYLLYKATDKAKDKIAELIIDKKPELTNNDVEYLLLYATDKDRIAELLQRETDNISKLENNHVKKLLKNVTDKDKMAELIIKYKKLLSDDNVKVLLYNATDKDKIVELLQKETDNLSKLSDWNVENLLFGADDKYGMAELIINKKPELSDDDVFHLLNCETDQAKDKIAELIINKQPKLFVFTDKNVYYLLHFAEDKDKMAEIIINKKPELSDDNVRYLIGYAKNKEKIAELIIEKKQKLLSDKNVEDLLKDAKDNDQMAELIINKQLKLTDKNVENLLDYAEEKDKIAELIIDKKPDLTDSNVYELLRYAIDKEKIAQLLQKEKDNISRFDKRDVYNFFIFLDEDDQKLMAQIINKYHTKKTPEIQKVIDTYL